MIKDIYPILLASTVLTFSGITIAEEITQESAEELMQECLKQREKNIAPLREESIEECVAKRGRDREYCENFNRPFGESRAIPGRGMQIGMFWELPVCDKALKAERYFKMNPGSKVYNLD